MLVHVPAHVYIDLLCLHVSSSLHIVQSAWTEVAQVRYSELLLLGDLQKFVSVFSTNITQKALK